MEEYPECAPPQTRDFSFLIEASAKREELEGFNDLRALEALCLQYQQKKARVEALESALADAKKEFNAISQQDIPEFLAKNGLSEITLIDGTKVSFSTDVAVTVKDMPAFMRFLESQNAAHLAQATLEMGKLSPEILQQACSLIAQTLNVFPSAAYKIHPATLKKFIKELCGINHTEGVMALQELPSCVSVYPYYKTSVKRR